MNRFKKVVICLLLCFAGSGLISCGKISPEENGKTQKVSVTGLSFELEQNYLDINEQTNIVNVMINPDNATNKKVTFYSEDTTIAKTDGEIVKAVGYGSTYIVGSSLQNPEAIYKVKIEVAKIHVTEINFSLNKSEIEIDDFAIASVTVLPSFAINKNYQITANPSDIVKIEDDKITGVKTGVVSLKAKSLDNGIESNSLYLQVKEPTAKGVSLECNKTSLMIGETSTLTYKVSPDDVADKQVSFKTESGNTNIISVSQSGVVTAKGVGEDYAVIYLTNKPEVFNKIKFTVVAVQATGLNVSVSKTEIEALENVQIVAEVLPSDATDKNVAYETKSGKNDVIKVSKTGLVTGINPGNDGVICYLVGNPSIKKEISFKVKETPAGDINVTESSVTMRAKETHQITAKVLPENATDKSLSYMPIDRNDYSDKGQRFESGVDCTVNLANPYLNKETMHIDICFDKQQTKQKISLMLGQGWNKYFGYFNIYDDGSLETNYAGVTAEEITEGMFRYTFDLSKVTKQNDKPLPDEYIDMVYIRGGWSLASGSILVGREIKEDILTVNSNGLVTAQQLGEQNVRVFLTNHPSIYKDVKFKVLSNPNDPTGDDIYKDF